MFTSDPGHRIEVRDDNRRVVDEAKALGASIGGLGRANEHEITPGPKSSTNRHRLSPHSTMRVKEHRFRRASSDWIKLTTVSRSPHVSFFFRSVGCNRREVLLTYLHQLNISGPRWPG